jgi:hypothetical protein
MPHPCSLVEEKNLRKSPTQVDRMRTRMPWFPDSATEELGEVGMVKTRMAKEVQVTIHLLRMNMAEGGHTRRVQEGG